MTQLPPGWHDAELGDFMVERSGSVDPARFPDEEFDLYSIPAHDRGGFDVVMGNEIGSSKRVVAPGDVMVSKIVPHIQRARVVDSPGPRRQIASTEWITFRSSVHEPDFLRYFMLSSEFHDQFMRTVSGVGGSLNRAQPSQVRSIRAPIPPLDEQRRIVALLDDYLSRLQVAATSVASASRRAELLRSAALATLARPGDQVVSLGDLADVGTGSTPPRSDPSNYEGGTIPWVTSGDIAQGRIVEIPHVVTAKGQAVGRLKRYPVNTLVVAMYGEGKTRGTVGRLGVAATMNQACAAVRVHDPSHVDWVESVLRGNYAAMRRMAAGGVQPNLNLSLVRSIGIPLPERVEREARLESLGSISEAVDRVRESIAASEKRQRALRRSLLSSAFRGQLGQT